MLCMRQIVTREYKNLMSMGRRVAGRHIADITGDDPETRRPGKMATRQTVDL